MKIVSVVATWVSFPIPSQFQHVSDFGSTPSADALIVRVETDCGIVGWGEGKNAAGSTGVYSALQALVQYEFAPLLVGRDPRQIRQIWNDLYCGARAGLSAKLGRALPHISRRGISVAAISAIDLALWDILGKHLEAPVWQLLGGRRAESLSAYGSGGWAEADGIGDELTGYIEKYGFTALKMRIGAIDSNLSSTIDRIHAARDAVGPDVGLACDAHGTLTVPEAKRLCASLEGAHLLWLEEVVSPDDKAGMAEVRSGTSTPIAAGESEYTRYDFQDLIRANAVDIVQPDLAICGGMTEGLRIDALAAANHVELVPHMWGGPVSFAAGLHLASSSSNNRFVEFPMMTSNPMLTELIEESFIPENGLISVPDRVGFGVTIREDVLQEYARKLDLG